MRLLRLRFITIKKKLAKPKFKFLNKFKHSHSKAGLKLNQPKKHTRICI